MVGQDLGQDHMNDEIDGVAENHDHAPVADLKIGR